MRRELYIGGRLADIDNTAVPLNFACSEIADLSGVSGNYSLTVKLPLTGNNIMIAYFANLPNTSPAALWTGYKTTASYFINGVPIFQDATAKLLSVEKTIDIQITFGNLLWLDVLEAYKLKDYVSIGQIHDWNYWAIENETTEVRWLLADYGGTFENGLHMEKMFPCVNAIRIWNNLFSRMIVNGVIDGGGSSVFMDYDLWLPLTNVYHNPELTIKETFSLSTSLELSDVADPIRSTDGLSSFAITPNHPGMVFTNVKGFFIVPVNGSYRIRMGSSFYVVVSSGQYDTITASFDLKYRADDSVAVNLFTHSSVDGVSNESYPIDFDEVVTLKKGDVLYLELNVSQSGLPGYSAYTELTDSSNLFSIEYVAEVNKKVRSEFFMPIDIDYNLPDMTCKDFVKAVMQFYGLLVENKDDGIDKTVKFFNLNTLKSDRIPDGNIVDWSDKLVSFDRPKIEWNLGLKERNYLRYTEDDTDNVFEDAYFTSYETDNGEKDIFKSLFAASDDVTLTGTSYTPVPVCSVPVWVIDEKTNEWKFEGKARQRIFRGYLNTEDTFDLEVVQLYSEGYDPIMITQADVYVSYFKDVPAQIAETDYGLDMSSIIARNYTGFIDAVKSNRLFTFQFLLNEIDINRFTHITPVWIEKFSNFFFVKKINNWEAGRVCSVEMLQLYDSGAIGTRQVITAVKYGLLYNWYAATDARLICAEGWEVPTLELIDVLIDYCGGYTGESVGKLKEIGTTYWDSPNINATNEVNYNLRGSGIREQTLGSFTQLKEWCYLWLTDRSISIPSDPDNGIGGTDIIGYESSGQAIRPVKTTTSLTHGQTGTYTGNDGKVYRTICIGTQEWLADNLCETKYRNGDTIPEVTDNSAWAALTTGALCAYNNDWSNVLID